MKTHVLLFFTSAMVIGFIFFNSRTTEVHDEQMVFCENCSIASINTLGIKVHSEEMYQFKKSASGSWTIDSPIQELPQLSQMDYVASLMSDSKNSVRLAKKNFSHLLTKQILRINWNDKWKINIYDNKAADGKYLGTINNTQFAFFDEKWVMGLPTSLEDWVDISIFSDLSIQNISSLESSMPESSFEWINNSNLWTSKSGKNLDPTQIKKYLRGMKELFAKKVLLTTDFRWQRMMQWKLPAGEVKTIYYWQQDGKTYLKRSDRNVTFQIDTAQFKQMQWQAKDFLPKAGEAS